ncbi:MAG TPA: ATP-binding protein [Kofleriaceae bacterium]|nr:ATP-binding protein [Kofleriaceae bacterium]
MADRRIPRPRAARRRLQPVADQAERIAELEAELVAARKTIAALLDKAEQRASSAPEAAVFEAAARLEQLVAQRTLEVEEKSRALESANSELRAITKNLDQIVRARTRALTESEVQLREMNLELSRMNAAKAEFISIAAHELRTPLTSICGYLEMFMEGKFAELPEAATKPLQSLQRNALRLKRLVDEMLDLSRIEAGKIVLHRTECDLGEIVTHVVDELRPLAVSKRQSLQLELRPTPALHADVDKIHQVVTNLVANAVRYTPEDGSIWVITDGAPQDTYAGPWARLRVRDNGIGIPADLRGRIFEPFTDVNSAKHHTSSGPDSAGLGLYIARGLVDLHGGLITVNSEEGQYTEFTVLLPVAG